jgi:hypothetical protein
MNSNAMSEDELLPVDRLTSLKMNYQKSHNHSNVVIFPQRDITAFQSNCFITLPLENMGITFPSF